MKRFLLNLIQQKWLQHLVFWVLSIYVIASYFAISNELATIDFIYSILFHGCLWSIVYLNLRIALPLFWSKGRYLLYLLSFAALIGVGLTIHQLFFDVLGPALISHYFFVSFTQTSVILGILGIYLLLSTLLHLSRAWFSLQHANREKSELELASLKSQLNPHFLFNGLNSVYALSLKNDPKAPETLLKLSDLLRYALYEVKNDVVPLVKELSMIDSYLDIQKTRLKSPDLIFYENEVTPSCEISIPPMLILPLIENVFKHGDLSQRINFSIYETSQQLVFESKNTVQDRDELQTPMNDLSGDPSGDPSARPSSGGIGLKNIRKRLALLYPNDHQFETELKNKIFRTRLTLNIS